MNKTLQLSPAMLLGMILTIAPMIVGTIWAASDLYPRITAMETKLVNSNTGALSERLTQVEERVQFNSDTTDDIWESIEKLDVEMKDMEDKLAGWMERELAKVYDLLKNDNPLGQ